MSEEKRKMQAIIRFLAFYPAGSGSNQELFMRVLLERCARVSANAVERTVDRFADGEVERANRAFAPSGEEFMVEVRRIQDCLDAVERAKTPRLARPSLFNAETRAEAAALGFLPGEVRALEGKFCWFAAEREDFYPGLNYRQAWSAFLADEVLKKESRLQSRQSLPPQKQQERFAVSSGITRTGKFPLSPSQVAYAEHEAAEAAKANQFGGVTETEGARASVQMVAAHG